MSGATVATDNAELIDGGTSVGPDQEGQVYPQRDRQRVIELPSPHGLHVEDEAQELQAKDARKLAKGHAFHRV
eukprot:CAMPEP_0180810622 /NCGR_PEP_ID=MMETSP1038_2-20121128/64985_1 /TAXON_ID=632150 /ORGANISM="Azadinium spinosum, Strain 3D9" /LENGTH=72 /DNA_ID=CAMNT_0022851929 /DNA_START=105 /DNA_END=319 /DNA_ORIENTATION=-